MSNFSFTRLHAALALGVLASSLSVQAHAQSLLSASAELSNLRYRLVDLDATDGITPWVAFGLGQTSNSPLVASEQDGLQRTQFFSSYAFDGLTAEGNAAAGTRQDNAINVFGSDTMRATDGSGLVSFNKGDGQLSTQMNVSSSQLLDGRFVSPTTGNLGFIALAAISPQSPAASVGFVVSPKTQLIIEADISLLTALDEAALQGSLASYLQGAKGLVDIRLQSSASIGVTGINHVNSGYSPDIVQSGDGVSADLSAQVSKDGVRLSDGGFGFPATAVKSALVRFTNASPWQSDGDLTYGTITIMTLSSTGLVPEPSTYALMGLGLVGLSVVARQRRAKRVH